ncbi:MAG: carboxypeptidase-like regulatory domain-containing protein [Bacteroidota bacterium]
MKKLNALLVLLALLSASLAAQTVTGSVLDATTQEPLAYVHIGVPGKNLGVISTDVGTFRIDLSTVGPEEKIRFSILGYETRELKKAAFLDGEMKVQLRPIAYPIEGILVTSTKSEKLRLGRDGITKTTTGQGGVEKFGYGGEWGLRIQHEGQDYYLETINFHTRFNTMDSVLFRINVYAIADGLPGKSLLTKPQFTTSYKKDKWITTDMLTHELLVTEDVIITFELVRIWYGKRGGNLLFYTHGKDYSEGRSFSRESSFAAWEVDKRAPLAMYVTGLLQE